MTGNTILASLSERLDICPNTRVSHISYGSDGVRVGDMAADYVVCTVSLGVLKAGAAVFEPALPRDVQDAIDALGFGTVTKIALKFGEPFWELETQYIGIMTEPKGRWNYWLNYRTVSVENILLGLSFGQYAPVADRMNREDMTQDVISVLKSVWGAGVTAPQAVLTTHWAEDSNFRGDYSYRPAAGSIFSILRALSIQ